MALIGRDAFNIPPMLWAYASVNQRDGKFGEYTPADFESILHLARGAGQKVLRALSEVGFIDADGRLHNWRKRNKYFSTNHERAKKAAQARYRMEEQICQAHGFSRDYWLGLPKAERRRCVEEWRSRKPGGETAPPGNTGNNSPHPAKDLTNVADAAQTLTPAAPGKPEKGTGKSLSSAELWKLKERVRAIDDLLRDHTGRASHPKHDKLKGPEFRALKRDRENLQRQIAGLEK